MKTFKTTQPLIFSILLVVLSCNNHKAIHQDEKSDSTTAVVMRSKCPEAIANDVRSRMKYNEYIIRIDPCAKKQWPKKVKHKIDSLKGVYELLEIDTCKCDPNLIRFKSNQENPKPEERLATINDKLKTEGTILGSAIYNMDLVIPDSTPPIRSIKEFDQKGYDIDNQMLIAVIDGGINLEENEDLEDYMWNKPNSVRCGDIHGLNLTGQNDVETYHGSLVSRFIVNNLSPDDIKLMDLRIFDNNGDGSLFKAMCALSFAIDKNADIINLSWGYYIDSIFKKPPFLNLIWEAKMKDIIIVCSSGNDGVDTDDCIHLLSGLDNKKFKKYTSNVIGVAYLNKDLDSLNKNSNYGKKSISLAAKGVFRFSDELIIEGSSYAAPQVTRAMAIIKGNKPNMNQYELIDCLHKNYVDTLKSTQSKLIMEGKLKYPFAYQGCNQ